jgi:lactate racemase
MNRVRLPQMVWNGVRDLELGLPDRWEINIYEMNGSRRPQLSAQQIKTAITNPIGSEPLHIMARNKKQVAIIFDDIQRATRVAEIIPFVLEELAEAGIPDDRIRFIGATGCHAAMDRYDFVKKLGENVLHRFPVYNHNAFGSCEEAGTTSYGTRVMANAEVLSCDFKIGIGSIVPHAFAGFGGGAKIILPGICAFETCRSFHRSGSHAKQKQGDQAVGLGLIEGNQLRLDMEEAAALVGLDCKIDAIINSYGETAAIYAGSLKTAYPLGVKDAQKHYDTIQATDQDIVIANTFAKVAECESGLEMAIPSLKKTGGDLVLIGNAPEGHVAHYLGGPWGKKKHSTSQMQCALPECVKRLIIFNEFPDLTIFGYFAQPEKVRLMTKWSEVTAFLEKEHPGQTSVAIYPNADIQYSSRNSGSSILNFEIA